MRVAKKESIVLPIWAMKNKTILAGLPTFFMQIIATCIQNNSLKNLERQKLMQLLFWQSIGW